MSRSRGCRTVEVNPGEWWCAVAYREYDYDMDSGEKFGPAASALEADELMDCSNPGGGEIVSHANVTDDDRAMLDRMDVRRALWGYETQQ